MSPPDDSRTLSDLTNGTLPPFDERASSAPDTEDPSCDFRDLFTIDDGAESSLPFAGFLVVAGLGAAGATYAWIMLVFHWCGLAIAKAKANMDWEVAGLGVASASEPSGSMTQPFSDIETAILHVRRAKITVMEQRERIAFLIAKGHSVGLARDLLAALESNLELTRKHLHLAIDDLRGYRYHLTLNGEIEAVQPLARTNDAKAILDVALVMDSTSPEFGAEIWNGKKLVMRIPPRMR